MVRELHALYSNLVPISDTESPQFIEAARKGAPKPKYVLFAELYYVDSHLTRTFARIYEQTQSIHRFIL